MALAHLNNHKLQSRKLIERIMVNFILSQTSSVILPCKVMRYKIVNIWLLYPEAINVCLFFSISKYLQLVMTESQDICSETEDQNGIPPFLNRHWTTWPPTHKEQVDDSLWKYDLQVLKERYILCTFQFINLNLCFQVSK